MHEPHLARTRATPQDADTSTLISRIEQLEQRVARLEANLSERSRRASSRSDSAASAGAGAVDTSGWSRPYESVTLEVSETWIELHEHSARPQLQRLLRELIQGEGPVTERQAVDRIRKAWGLRRAGGRVQEAIDQSIRQLVARGLIERDDDALQPPGLELDTVRIPGEDEESRRAADEVPTSELALAMRKVVEQLPTPVATDELGRAVAKVFGWTRRGGAIQERLDTALARAIERGELIRTDDGVSPAEGEQ